MTVKVYTAAHCVPCHTAIDALKSQGNIIDGEEVEVVDVETDEGFSEFHENVLSKTPKGGEVGVPMAYKDGQCCRLDLTDGKLSLSCPA